MSPEKTQALINKYPKIFEHTKYLGCTDGWYDLIDTLCFNIQRHVDRLTKDGENTQVHAVQIKEKFGMLRFYHDGGDAVIGGLVSFAEELSGRICERCGKPGRLREGSWLLTLCDECQLRREAAKSQDI